MNRARKTQSVRRGPVWSRSESLFALTALTVLAGLLIPLPGRFLDALWILCICLTTSVLLICRSAQNSSQLDGFPALTAGAGLLTILLTTGSIKCVVLQHSSGLVALKVGRLVAFAATETTAPLLLILLGIGLTFSVCYSAFRIRKAIEEYLFRVLPFKRAGLETDRTLHVLTREKSLILENTIRREAGFFASMGGIGFLFNGLMICSLLIVSGGFGLIWMLEKGLSSNINKGQALAPLAGTAVLSWAALSSIVPACAALLSKKSFVLETQQETPPDVTSQQVFVVSPETGQAEAVELLNPDFQTHTRPVVPVEPAEQVVEFEPEARETTRTLKRIEIKGRYTQSYYQTLSRLIRHPKIKRHLVLLTSEKQNDLPVTVAVHTAALTAGEDKVLLVDADTKRQAVGKVFELEPDKTPARIHKTKIPGLSVLAPNLPPLEALGLLDSMEKMLAEFSQIILYAPQQDIQGLMRQTMRDDLLVLYLTQEPSTSIAIAESNEQETLCLSVQPMNQPAS